MIKKTIMDFLTQVMTVFAFMIIVINIFCALLGTDAKAYSTIFALGNEGIPVSIVFQFLGVAVLIVGIRFLFTSDLLIKRMQNQLRLLCMLASIFLVIVAFVVLCRWFPLGLKNAWFLFLTCYIISFLGSYLLSMLKMKQENRQLDEALQRLKNSKERI